jgi:hypothetical protein
MVIIFVYSFFSNNSLISWYLWDKRKFAGILKALLSLRRISRFTELASNLALVSDFSANQFINLSNNT